MESAENIAQEKSETRAPQGTSRSSPASGNVTPTGVEPDLDFILALNRQSGDFFLKCFQCGTCSATCAISPDLSPFPRKEMAWANWGIKDLLLADPDVWLCYQCNDCSIRCPRGARPGDLLGAVRQQGVIHYSFPRFFGRWVNEPQCLPLLLGIPVALLSVILFFKEPLGEALGFTAEVSQRIVYSYSSIFPHWLLNGFFFLISLFVLLVMGAGVIRLWRAMKAGAIRDGFTAPVKGLFPSLGAALKEILTHDQFTTCTHERPRYISHMCVFFGFMALCVVTFWIITAGINPLMQKDFVYPYGFWNPWKVLANAGGAALFAGLFIMILGRIKNSEQAGAGGFFDWSLIGTLLAVVGTGFFTEVLHYQRLEPHRHIAYFVHLVFVCALFLYLPYSKLAHLVYRTTAMVFAEHIGRNNNIRSGPVAAIVQTENKEADHAGTGHE